LKKTLEFFFQPHNSNLGMSLWVEKLAKKGAELLKTGDLREALDSYHWAIEWAKHANMETEVTVLLLQQAQILFQLNE
jgi:hypothetical protein